MNVRPRVWLPLAGSALLAFPAAPLSQTQNPGSASEVVDVRREKPAPFDPLPVYEIRVEPIGDGELGRLIATLEGLLAAHDEPARRAYDADYYYRDFVERLQSVHLSAAQEARVLELFDALAARYPADGTAIERERRTLSSLAVGKVAPDITGADLDGVDFRLSDYRGKVVVVAFSGEWCGSCRAEYPYYRLLEELYAGQPFAILGVSADKDPATAKKAKAERRLGYRTWFDGRSNGSIAAAWGVAAWPTTYVLDQDGVVRFVNLRQDNLLKGVRQLMETRR